MKEIINNSSNSFCNNHRKQYHIKRSNKMIHKETYINRMRRIIIILITRKILKTIQTKGQYIQV